LNPHLAVLVASLAAALNPALIAAAILMFLLPNPKRLMLGYLAGACATSLAAGLGLVFSLHGSGVARTSSHLISPGEDIIIGAVALAIALALLRRRDAPLRRWNQRRKAARARAGQAKQPWQQRMLGKGSAAVLVVLLVAYCCFMQQLVLELALLAVVIAPERAQAFAVRSRAWLTSHGRAIAVTGLAVIGMLLLAHGLITIG
jgi:hypothetical protein